DALVHEVARRPVDKLAQDRHARRVDKKHLSGPGAGYKHPPAPIDLEAGSGRPPIGPWLEEDCGRRLAQIAAEDRAIVVAAHEIVAGRRLICNTLRKDRISGQDIAPAAASDLGAQAPEQNIVRPLVLGMQLEARPL